MNLEGSCVLALSLMRHGIIKIDKTGCENPPWTINLNTNPDGHRPLTKEFVVGALYEFINEFQPDFQCIAVEPSVSNRLKKMHSDFHLVEIERGVETIKISGSPLGTEMKTLLFLDAFRGDKDLKTWEALRSAGFHTRHLLALVNTAPGMVEEFKEKTKCEVYCFFYLRHLIRDFQGSADTYKKCIPRLF